MVLAISQADNLVAGLTEYFTCEAGGHVPGRCSREVFQKYLYPYVSMTTYILQGLCPLSVLNYVIDWKSVQKMCKESKPSWSTSFKAFCRNIHKTTKRVVDKVPPAIPKPMN